MQKIITFIIFIMLFQQVKAQNEFITIWKPSNASTTLNSGIPYMSTHNQIWFPIRGTNFTINWEEIGFPLHTGTLTAVNSTSHILIDFGTSHSPNPANTTYRVKVSNGSGNVTMIRFQDNLLFPGSTGIAGDNQKIIDVEQWGNINWQSMESAFSSCSKLNISATDIPNFTNVSDMSNMFVGCSSLIGNSSINNWDISRVTNLSATFSGCTNFNQPIGNWNTGNVKHMGTLFFMAKNFNQDIGNWDTSKVESMAAMFNHAQKFNQPIGNWDLSSNLDLDFTFSNALAFNQPLANWNTSSVLEMSNMFGNAKSFNQDISSWDTSNVIIMGHMFGNAIAFNQNIGNWDTSNVISFQNTFNGATAFNQNLGNWNLSSIFNAENMFLNSGMNCQNYDSTLYGWSNNPSTPSSIIFGSVSPMVYSHPAAVIARNNLINNKNWSIYGDSYNGECNASLSTSENSLALEAKVYPNPAENFIYLKNIKNGINFTITDSSGRIVLKDSLSKDYINIQTLTPGNYILQIVTKDKIQSLKFIKK